jgi:hypothetical protein
MSSHPASVRPQRCGSIRNPPSGSIASVSGQSRDAHSKKMENHEAMLGLYFAWYNFCRMHSSIKTTPAAKAGLTAERWTLETLLTMAAKANTTKPRSSGAFFLDSINAPSGHYRMLIHVWKNETSG